MWYVCVYADAFSSIWRVVVVVVVGIVGGRGEMTLRKVNFLLTPALRRQTEFAGRDDEIIVLERQSPDAAKRVSVEFYVSGGRLGEDLAGLFAQCEEDEDGRGPMRVSESRRYYYCYPCISLSAVALCGSLRCLL